MTDEQVEIIATAIRSGLESIATSIDDMTNSVSEIGPPDMEEVSGALHHVAEEIRDYTP